MSIITKQSRGGLSFIISGDVYERISEWSNSIDEGVFEEQLESELFRGRSMDPRLIKLMKHAKEQGSILPYYGAGGSRGCCKYTFRQTDAENLVCVLHTHTKESQEFLSVSGEIEEVMPDDRKLIFAIDGKEYKILRSWKMWNKKEAMSSRYAYSFGIVSLGRGYTTKVKDNVSNSELDVTDYGSW